jgi:hypothetical protein
MKPKPNLKETLFRILDKYEQVYAENSVLKMMLSTSYDSRVSTTWEETMNQLLAGRTFRAKLHATFDALRAQVLAELDAEAALQLLLKLPLTGRPN